MKSDPNSTFDKNAIIDICHRIGFSHEITEAFCDSLPLCKEPKLQNLLHNFKTDVLAGRPLNFNPEISCPMLYAHAFLQIIPHTISLHKKIGIPPKITFDTLQDLELWIKDYYQHHGKWGIEELDWPKTYLLGNLFAIGRLQFEMIQFPASCRVLDNNYHLQTGDAVLSIHIPARGTLDKIECEKSFVLAEYFFKKYFSNRHFKAAICISWMLNPCIQDYLLPDSNLVHFYRRFSPLTLIESNDEQAWKRITGHPPTSLENIPQKTTLQSALKKHYSKGKKWETSAGYIPWPPPQRLPINVEETILHFFELHNSKILSKLGITS